MNLYTRATWERTMSWVTQRNSDRNASDRRGYPDMLTEWDIWSQCGKWLQRFTFTSRVVRADYFLQGSTPCAPKKKKKKTKPKPCTNEVHQREREKAFYLVNAKRSVSLSLHFPTEILLFHKPYCSLFDVSFGPAGSVSSGWPSNDSRKRRPEIFIR
jgi:hypothetical protein